MKKQFILSLALFVLAAGLASALNCTDTDGGIVLKVQGAIGAQPDFCIGGTILWEAACDPCNNTNQTKFYAYNCLTYGFTGCSAGACVPNTVPEPALPNVCTCGNGVVDPGETCDDGSPSPTSPSDGCANCILTYCGDGWIQSPNGQGTGGPANNGYEQCDDGNTVPGDGCTNCKNDTSLSVNWAYYKATCQTKNSILTEWSTTMEQDTIGFNVLWSDNKNGQYITVSPFIYATGSGSNYQWTDTNTDASPITPKKGIYNWYKVRELSTNGPGDETAPFTTERICDQPIYCGGIANISCPTGYRCICPRPTPGTSDPQCICQEGIGTTTKGLPAVNY